jgi:hypothetical protein
MSEFLMVVPVGWVEVPDAQAFVDRHTEAQILDLIGSNQLAGVEARLQDDGLIAPDASMLDFRMFRDGGACRIWVLLG